MTATQTQRTSTSLQSLAERLAEARQNTDALLGIVKTENLYDRPISERHRIVFYLGHLEAFEWNLFRQGNPAIKSFSPEYDKLFAFGIDPVDGGLPSDEPKDWPTLEQIAAYNTRVRRTLDDAIDSGNLVAPGSAPDVTPETLLNVAIEHRLMHSETLAYMLHRLPFEKKNLQRQEFQDGPAVANESVNIPAGSVTLGLQRSDVSRFGWDNEYEQFTQDIPAFQIDKFMVTNADFLEFLLEGGYENRSLWTPEDWKWKTENNISHPAFWENVDGRWFYRGMFESRPLPVAGPAYVSHAEATAYANWKGKALPSEAQWQRAASGSPENHQREFPWGNEFSAQEGNFDFRHWDSVDVNAFPQNQSAFGVVGQLGNGWEWTSSPFAPYKGFRQFSFYPGYSANFFDGKHYVIKGGSARTAACMLRSSFRNWFQPHYQYVYAGFRCITI